MNKSKLKSKLTFLAILLALFASNAMAQSNYWDTWTELTASAGSTLTGNYKVTADRTITGANTNTAGLIISGIVNIYIAEGVTLTVTGAPGGITLTSGTLSPGQPGIRLNSGQTLIIRGGGTLVATGGNAAAGSSGGTGGAGTFTYSGVNGNMQGGEGGFGGGGGGGAGAGIGTAGGAGGSFTNNGAARLIPMGITGNTNVSGYWASWTGDRGSNGRDGNASNASGTLYILDNATVRATGGSRGNIVGGGGSGGHQSGRINDSGSGWANDYTASNGGG
ncbi:MAG: hypothetical protein LBC85_00080, partial [Fibromonadaceae bacterium]|nr:hypothetical protein [Fibromonadaceae bacterium]